VGEGISSVYIEAVSKYIYYIYLCEAAPVKPQSLMARFFDRRLEVSIAHPTLSLLVSCSDDTSRIQHDNVDIHVPMYEIQERIQS
jgi:hypothetical protein